MSFNRGWLCDKCGPVKESVERSINKVKRKTCKQCGSIVKPWERPMNERAGRCNNCGHGGFKLAIVKSHLVRACKQCNEVYDTDAEKTIRKGAKQ